MLQRRDRKTVGRLNNQVLKKRRIAGGKGELTPIPTKLTYSGEFENRESQNLDCGPPEFREQSAQCPVPRVGGGEGRPVSYDGPLARRARFDKAFADRPATTGRRARAVRVFQYGIFKSEVATAARDVRRPFGRPLARRARVSTRHLLTGMRRRAEGPSYIFGRHRPV